MVQKSSYLAVLEVFFKEPTAVHFIKEISRQIGLAPTSVRANIGILLREGLIKRKKAGPFEGAAANRESSDFLFYKRVYNLYSLKSLAGHLSSACHPSLISVFGSYSRGEDTEQSDIDLVMVSKAKKCIGLDAFESGLKRKIHLIVVSDIEKLEPNIRKKVYNGIVLYGGF